MAQGRAGQPGRAGRDEAARFDLRFADRSCVREEVHDVDENNEKGAIGWIGPDRLNPIRR